MIPDTLSRDDKWTLGGGSRLLWAPSHPAHPEVPGFWDEAHWYNYAFAPGFTAAIVERDGSAWPLRPTGHTWRPDRIEVTYAARNGAVVRETRSLHPEDALTCRIEIETGFPLADGLRWAVWTAMASGDDTAASASAPIATSRHLSWLLTLRRRGQPDFPVHAALSLHGDAASAIALHAQGRVVPPRWDYTPFFDRFGAADTIETGKPGPDDAGVWWMGLETPVVASENGTAALTAVLAIDPVRERASTNAGRIARLPDPAEESAAHWERFCDGVPELRCSDPGLETWWAYRWYGLHMNLLPGGEEAYPDPVVCEGPAYFRAPITYSAQCHMREMRWHHDPAAARGALRTFLHHQQDDGRFIGYIAPRSLPSEFFYHANWGFVLDVDAVHPDREFLSEVYDGLCRYVAYFDRERDSESSGLYDIHNHYETGQEYMHRYQAVDRGADRQHWGSVFRLKGIDVSVYLYEIKRALATIAHRLDRGDDADAWTSRADQTARAIRESMWDPDAGMFFDIDPRTGERTGVRAAVCFYPYMTDLVNRGHLSGLRDNLLDPRRFWTPFPVPSSSLDDPYFDPDARWKGQRMNCPWNGRVWPMTNSHVAEALGRSAIRFGDDALRETTVDFIMRFIRMMSFQGDPARPNSFEHYHPVTGRASVYRGIDDYQHSWVNDLLVTYLAGLRPAAGGLVVDPFPFPVEHVTLQYLRMRGRRVSFERHGREWNVEIDGRLAASGTVGEAVQVAW